MVDIKLCKKKDIKNISLDLIQIDLQDLEQYYNFQENNEFEKIIYKKIGNRSIVEWFSYEQISYWWLISAVIFPKFNEGVIFIERILNLINDKNPSKIILDDFFDKYSLLHEICKQHKIDLKINCKKKYFYDQKQRLSESIKPIRYKKILKEKKEKRLTCFSKKNTFSVPLNDYVIVTGINRRIKQPTLSGEIKKQDFIIQPIIDLIKKNNYPLLCIDLDYTLKGTIESLSERLETDVNWIPVEFFSKGQFTKKTHNIINKLQNNFKLMNKNDMEDHFSYKCIPLWSFLQFSFNDIFLEPYLPTYVDLIEKFETFFSNHKPVAIIQVYEVGPFAKTIEIAAKKFDIRTIGIQHGMLNEPEHDYTHKEVYSLNSPLGSPIPDSTFVFGEYYKKILTEDGNYPPDKVTVTGNLNWFYLDKFLKVLDRGELLKKYQFINKKIILIPLSFRIAYAKKNLSDRVLLNKIYETLGKNNDFIFLIRPHPGDEFDQKILDDLYPNSNFKCSHASLVEDLILCDVVVITYSTVGLESALFKKPVIFVNLNKKNKLQFYSKIPLQMIDNEIALYSELDEIDEIINNIFENKWTYDSLSKRNNFLKYVLNYENNVDLLKLIFNNT